jgi:hypothetical protein
VVIKLGGRGFGSMGRSKTKPPVTTPTLSALALSASTVAENTAAGGVVGSVLNKTSGSTLSLTGDAGGRFTLNGSNQIVVGLVALSQASSPYSITIRETLAGATNTPRDTTIQITVTAAVTGFSFSSTDKASTITLSSGNLTATRSGGTEVSHLVRSNTTLPTTGKFQWECKIGSGTNPVGFGICNTTQSLTPADANYPGHTADAFAYWRSGYIAINDTVTPGSTGDSFGVNSIVTFCYDADAQSVWVSVGASGTWNASSSANPATGTGGISLSGITGNKFVFAALSDASSGNLNIGDVTFTRSVSGFAPLKNAGATTILDEAFTGSTLPAGWNGQYLDGSYSAVNNNTTALSIVSGQLRISATTGSKLYPAAFYTLTGRTAGEVVQINMPYTVSTGGALFVRVTANASGSSSGLLDGNDLTGSGTYTHSFTVPSGSPTLYFFIFNDTETTSTVDIDRVTLTLSGGAAPSLAALTLSSSSISESSTAGTVIGTIQNKTTGSTLSLSDDAGGRFAINGSNQLVRGSTALNYATATSHTITITETLSGATNSPRDTTLTITVTQASGALYSEDFSSGTLPAGWSGRWLNAASGFATVNDQTVLSFVSGQMRISATTGSKAYPSAIRQFVGRAGGDVIRLDIPYTVSTGGACFVRITSSSDGSDTGILTTADLTGTGTISQNFTVPDGGPVLYLFIYNDTETTSTVDIDSVTWTLLQAGTGGTASAINWLSSKYPVSFAGRTGMQIRMSTDVPADFAIQSGLQGSEFTLEDRGTAGFWLTHPTGTAGKQVTVRATSKSDNTLFVDQTHTLYQKPAINTTTGMFVEPYYAVWTDAYPTSDVDFSKSEIWNIFSVTPDSNGDLWTTGQGSYWSYGPSRPLDIATRVRAAGKLPILTFGGGGLWADPTKNVSLAISTPTKRAALVTALIAEVARLNVIGVAFDIEKGDNFVPADWVKVHDLIRRFREAAPDLYCAFPFGGTMFKGTALYADPSMPEYGPSIAGLCDWFMAMDYSMDQKNVIVDQATGVRSPANKTWYSSPIRGAQLIYHRLDVENLIDWYTRNGMDVKKCLLGSTLMAAYDVGATGPDQWINPNASGFWDQHATYDNVTDYYNVNMFYDYERKASYGLVPVDKGDGITYISFERAQDWVDRASWALSKGLLGGILWQTANTHFPSRFYPIFAAFQSLSGATVSSDPNYAAGTTVTSQTFSVTGNEPAGWFGYARPAAGVGPWGRDTAALTTSGGKLQIANRSGHTEVNAVYALDNLTAPGLYVCFVDIVTDANSALEILIYDGDGKNTDATYIPPNTTLTNYMVRCWAFTPYMEIQFYNHTTSFSTVTIDNFVVKGPIAHVTAG